MRLAQSDALGEFVERARDASHRAFVDAELEVAAAQVLHERMAAHDHAGGAVAFESAHRPQSCFQAAVVGLDPIVRVLLRRMIRSGHHVADHAERNWSSVRHDLSRFAMAVDRRGEEPARCVPVAAG
jgi:hypothetical protein